eukprot:3144595-Prymnesium_polylepis.1
MPLPPADGPVFAVRFRSKECARFSGEMAPTSLAPAAGGSSACAGAASAAAPHAAAAAPSISSSGMRVDWPAGRWTAGLAAAGISSRKLLAMRQTCSTIRPIHWTL